jgi:hypothetical protein
MSDLHQTSTPVYSGVKAKQDARWRAARARMAGKPAAPAPASVESPASRYRLKQLLLAGGFPVTEGLRSGLEIIEEVSQQTGVSVGEILGPRRAPNLVAARHLAMWRVHKRLPHYSLPRIGRLFRRDHTTILYAVRKIEARASRGDALI